MYSVVLLLALAAAPAPRPLTEARLTGTWEMTWAGGKYTVIMKANGDYSCADLGGVYIGSWHVRDGVLWITESHRPEDIRSWRHFSIRLCPRTLQGRVLTGAPGAEIGFRQR